MAKIRWNKVVQITEQYNQKISKFQNRKIGKILVQQRKLPESLESVPMAFDQYHLMK